MSCNILAKPVVMQVFLTFLTFVASQFFVLPLPLWVSVDLGRADSHPDDLANGEGENGNLDIEEKILRRKEMAHLFQWYYPEGGWGWVIVFVAALCQALGQGMWHFGHTFPFSAAVKTRFRPLMTNTTLGVSTDTKAFFNMDLAVGKTTLSKLM